MACNPPKDNDEDEHSWLFGVEYNFDDGFQNVMTPQHPPKDKDDDKKNDDTKQQDHMKLCHIFTVKLEDTAIDSPQAKKVAAIEMSIQCLKGGKKNIHKKKMDKAMRAGRGIREIIQES
eukprot:439511_1